VATTSGALSQRAVSALSTEIYDSGQEWPPGTPVAANRFVKVRFSFDSAPVVLVVDGGKPLLDLIRDIASGLADEAHEIAWGEPFPPCPGHHHPMIISESNGEIGWACPRDPGDILRTIAVRGEVVAE